MSIDPGLRRRQQQLARLARRAPGYRYALEQVLPRIRRNAVLTDLAWRVFAPRHGAGQVVVSMHGGRCLAGPDVDRLPVVGVLGTGLDQQQAEALVDHVADLQRRHPSFRPLLVLDRPALAAARRHGYVVELVVPLEDWSSGDFGADGCPPTTSSWEAYLARRLGSLTDHYQLWHLARVSVTDGIPGLDPVDQALLAHLHERLPADVRAWAASTRPAQEDPAS